MVVTSPPFINAQNYYRTFKLNLFWLELISPKRGPDFHRKFIGSNNVSKWDHQKLHKTGISELDRKIEKIHEKDSRRAYVVYKFFTDMKQHFRQCTEILQKGGSYIITLGDNTIRKIPVPTHKYIAMVAEDVGFRCEFTGADRIRSRTLMSKRNETAGLMDVEWVVALRNKRGGIRT